jgi:ATP-dependent helicase HrpB
MSSTSFARVPSATPRAPIGIASRRLPRDPLLARPQALAPTAAAAASNPQCAASWPLQTRRSLDTSNHQRRRSLVRNAASPQPPAPPSDRAERAALAVAADLPILPQLPLALTSLDKHANLVLEAPPGAGKTTALPLALLEYDSPHYLASASGSGGSGSTILVVEPRRVAAKAAARRMCSLLGDGPPGSPKARVGYSVRLERRVGPSTRVVCVTEGVLIRRLLRDPSLAGVGAVLFDEYHERSADADTALALCLDAQRGGLRPDLRLVVMSATLGGGLAERLAEMMGGGAEGGEEGNGGGGGGSDGSHDARAPILTSQGRSFPVKTVYLGSPAMLADGREAAANNNGGGTGGGAGLFGGLASIARARPGVVEAAVADAVALALDDDRTGKGDVLAFLPGVAQIRRAQRLLAERHCIGRGGGGGGGGRGAVRVDVLHGSLPPAQQDAVLRPRAPAAAASPSPSRQRRVVLATPIAESSVTLDGVTAVVDCGLRRAPRFDPRTGVSRLVTVPISEAAADQRAGRAGRTAPGVCYRLFDSGEELEPATAPEMSDADLAPLALTLAAWGAPFDDSEASGGLRWLEPPDQERMARALELLRELGAVERGAGVGDNGDDPSRAAITARGRAMAALGAHPRFAQLAIRGGSGTAASGGLDCSELACVVASLLGERDVLVQSSGGSGASSAARSADLRTRLQALADYGGGGVGQQQQALFRGVASPRPDEVDRLLAERVLAGARQMHARVQALLEHGGEDEDDGEAVAAPAAALSGEEEEEEEEEKEEEEEEEHAVPGSATLLAANGNKTNNTTQNNNAAEAERRFHAAWTAQARRRPALVGCLVASAYPDRIARLKPSTFQNPRPEATLASGEAVTLPRPARDDPLLDGAPELLAVAELSGGGVSGKTGAARADVVRLAAPLPMACVEGAGALLAADVVEVESVAWAPSAKKIVAKKQVRLGALVLRESPLPSDKLTDERCAPVIVAALQREAMLLIGGGGGGGGFGGGGGEGDASGGGGNEAGLAAALGLQPAFEAWRARVRWLRAADHHAAAASASSSSSDPLPDLSAAALVRDMPRWLTPFLLGARGGSASGCRSRADVMRAVDFPSTLRAMLSAEQQRRVERDAPARLTLPLGGTTPVDYSHPAGPTARARVQEVFGLAETPRLAGGRVPVRLELLDPAQRPLAATADLATFWTVGWPLARKDMRGRYPKHVWPEDGAKAEPTKMTKAKTEAAAAAAAAKEAAAAAGGGGGKSGGGNGGGGGKKGGGGGGSGKSKRR